MFEYMKTTLPPEVILRWKMGVSELEVTRCDGHGWHLVHNEHRNTPWPTVLIMIKSGKWKQIREVGGTAYSISDLTTQIPPPNS